MSPVRRIRVVANGGIPNHPRWPALLHARAFAPEAAEALLRRHGWGGIWRWGVFDYHHFHPDAHEALLCVDGSARLRIGGEAGEDLDVAPGDALVLPAGFGHRCLESRPGFAVLGAYPPGQESPSVERAAADAGHRFGARIAALPRPERDPVTGGPMSDTWPDTVADPPRK
ncbi:cupin domain-containing protein [Limimaricola soesokkakensis]|uniref:cupin domain-containing protein n=1 Tax=Limimaricola soesokkakensis TaxID=1343159 RepID=UPI00351421C3